MEAPALLAGAYPPVLFRAPPLGGAVVGGPPRFPAVGGGPLGGAPGLPPVGGGPEGGAPTLIVFYSVMKACYFHESS